MHFHRDVLAVCDCFPRSTLKVRADDVFIGTPPLAFTFGLGGLLLFPLRAGASTVLLEKPTPDLLLQAIQDRRATICFTAPRTTARWRRWQAGMICPACAGPCPPGKRCRSTRESWHQATGSQ